MKYANIGLGAAVIGIFSLTAKPLLYTLLAQSRQNDRLGQKVYWAQDFDWAAELTENWEVVRDEFLAHEAANVPFAHVIHAKDIYKSQNWNLPDNMDLSWEASVVYAPPYGFSDTALKETYFPKTAALLQKIEDAGVPVYNFAFINLPGNSAVNPHPDMHPGVIHYFVTLENPDNDQHDVYIALHDNRTCPDHILLDNPTNNVSTVWSIHDHVLLDHTFVPIEPEWEMVDYHTGQGFLWDGFWHCHFVLNFAEKRRIVLALLLEKAEEFAAPEPFATINSVLSGYVMPKLAFWKSMIQSHKK